MTHKPAREPCYPCLAYLSTRGTFYDVGYNVGLNFSDKIKRYIAESDNIQKNVLPFFDTAVGREYFEESLKVTQECFPQYVREVRGMADGAGIPFEHLFVLHIFEKIHPESLTLAFEDKLQCPDSKTEAAGANNNDKIRYEFGCTTLFVNRPDLKLLVHNEDSDPLVKPYGYVISVDIEEDGMKEEFTSFCYPGILPGRAFNFNGHGVVTTTNALYPQRTERCAPSRVFLSRALLSARDVEDACRILQHEPYGVAYGFCANIATANGELMAIEVGPGKPCAQLHVHRVEEEKDPDKPGHYYHFNSYKHLEVPEISGLQSSARRAARTAQLPPPCNLQDALAILGDTEDPTCPVFRIPRPSDRGATVGTGAFDVINREVFIYQGNPAAASNKPIVRLPMYL